MQRFKLEMMEAGDDTSEHVFHVKITNYYCITLTHCSRHCWRRHPVIDRPMISHEIALYQSFVLDSCGIGLTHSPITGTHVSVERLKHTVHRLD